MRAMIYIQRLILVLVVGYATLLSSCAVHEWPKDGEKLHSFIINLEYTTEMPLYKDEVLQSGRSASTAADDYDVRYTIEVYTAPSTPIEEPQVYVRRVFSRDDVNQLDNSVEMELPFGSYIFKVWTDYVDAGKTTDKFYDTSSFEDVIFNGPHVANNDFRDAFVGSLEAEITELTTELTIDNVRPMGKFIFISNDLEKFIEHMLELKAESESESESEAEDNTTSGPNTEASTPSRVIDVSEYKVVFTYASFMPDDFNVLRDEAWDAADPNTVSFESSIKKISDSEAELGFDYVFVNDDELRIQIVVEVFDKKGVSVSRTNKITVPLLRGQYTIVRSNFLTSQAKGGVGINPSFEGPDHVVWVEYDDNTLKNKLHKDL